jgi:predicted membrane channel-forming protein YqfA (hemolysin III family)
MRIFSVPGGALCLVIFAFAFPRNYPHHCEPEKARAEGSVMQKIDFLGAFLLIAATILLVAALSEGEIRFPWNSAIIIAFFTTSGVLWVAFFAWERVISRKGSKIEPMFPWRFFGNRVWIGVLL